MAAISIGIASIVVSETHDIAAGVLIFVAQLLLFSASVFHLNYKLGQYGVSIHTPTKGVTGLSIFCLHYSLFQSTHPRRV